MCFSCALRSHRHCNYKDIKPHDEYDEKFIAETLAKVELQDKEIKTLFINFECTHPGGVLVGRLVLNHCIIR